MYEFKDSTICFDTRADALASPWRTPQIPLLVRLYAALTQEQIKRAISGKALSAVTWSTHEHAMEKLGESGTPGLFLTSSDIRFQSLRPATAGQEIEASIDSSGGVSCVDSLQKISVLGENGRWLTHGCRTPISDYVYSH